MRGRAGEGKHAFEHLSGRQKAAIVLIAIGKNAASKVMKEMAPAEIESVALEIAKMDTVSNATAERVLGELFDRTCGNRLHAGGVDYAREILAASLGEEPGENVLGRVRDSIESENSTVLNRLEASQLLSFLHDEHPQTIAFVLVHVSSPKAAAVLSGLPVEMRGEVARRMGRMGPTAPDAIQKIEDQLFRQGVTVHRSAKGGAQSVVDVLHRIDAAEEESILECIEEDDPELAEQIRDLLYVFQDVVELDGRAIQRLLKEVETKELALALKGATPEAREKIFENMTKRAKEVILEDMEFMGPVRLADIEGAQKSILMTLRRLREEGTVELANESVSAASEKE